MTELTDRLEAMQKEVDGLMQKLDIEERSSQAEELEKQSAAADFWNNPDAAQQVMQQISRLHGQIEPWKKLAAQISETLELAELEDDDLAEELSTEVEAITKTLDKMSFQAMFSGPYDNENAVLAIHSGAGGVDAQDWAEMLLRMYTRWAERAGHKVDEIEISYGEGAGIKSVTLGIQGDFACGYLQSEQGVHRLVRLSPFDSANRRHTSFVKVELWPDIQGEIDLEINEKDLRIDTYRSSGPGGQHVQKSDTAVRITHIPTGIVVQCQNQRSQFQNRDRAMQMLKARLLDHERQKQEAEFAILKGENVDAGWGNQIRSYVLHPYQMVKDHRTDHQTGNTQAVLDGDLNEFMEAYLRYRIEHMN